MMASKLSHVGARWDQKAVCLPDDRASTGGSPEDRQ